MKTYHCIQGVTCVTCYDSVLDEGCPNASISTINSLLTRDGIIFKFLHRTVINIMNVWGTVV